MALRHVLLIAAVAGLVLGVPVFLATGAFSQATLERKATVEVASDSQALLALQDGHPNNSIVIEKDDGTLAIDLTPGSAAGVNFEGSFVIGSHSEPINNHAFRIIHQGTQSVSITFNYDVSGGDPNKGPANVKFDFYEETTGGYSHLGQATEETGYTITDVKPGATVYAVIEIDTKGVSKGNDLSGAMKISAS